MTRRTFLTAAMIAVFVGILWGGSACQLSPTPTSLPDHLLSNERKIIVGADKDYPPFSFIDKEGVAQGFDVDFIREIEKYLSLKVEIRLEKWDIAQKLLEKGEIDVLAGVLYTESRNKIYDFTVPYNVEPVVIFINKNSRLNNIQSLENKRMAALKGDAIPAIFLNVNGLNVIITEYLTLTEAFLSVESNKNDFVLAPYTLGMEIINKNKLESIISLDPVVHTLQYRLAVKKGNTEILNLLNGAIERIRLTDFLEENKRKWVRYRKEDVLLTEILIKLAYFALPLIFIGLVLWIITLRVEVRKKTAALRELNEKHRTLAMYDPLTNLINRRRFYELTEIEIEKARRTKSLFGLLMIDLDNFKSINDTYGHDIGDMVLRDFSSKSRSIIRKYDILSRYGGEEFLILLPSTPKEMLFSVAEKIRTFIAEHGIDVAEQKLSYTVSIGCTYFDFKDKSIDDTIKRADQALQTAKNMGKNRVVQNFI